MIATRLVQHADRVVGACRGDPFILAIPFIPESLLSGLQKRIAVLDGVSKMHAAIWKSARIARARSVRHARKAGRRPQWKSADRRGNAQREFFDPA
jgi:hypothetical protein